MTPPFSRCIPPAFAVLAAFGFLATQASPAEANLQICNQTTSRVGVAVGYRDDRGWVTEGWWNMVPGHCETLLEGPLRARYYYVHAVDYDRGGEWGGQYFMCTQARIFTIRDAAECQGRGHERSGFFEIDTGDMTSWTIQLTDPVRPGPTAQGAGSRP
jgi:uncharacterized membrane protein